MDAFEFDQAWRKECFPSLPSVDCFLFQVEPAHHGGVRDVHPLEDALRQLPVLGRLLKGGVSDSQANND